MALVAELDELLAGLRRLRGERVAARALHGDVVVRGVDFGLHDVAPWGKSDSEL
jgi:hypothetical protein